MLSGLTDRRHLMALPKLLPMAQRSFKSFPFYSVRFFSLSSPEEAALDRRRRHRFLGMAPPSPLSEIPLPPPPGQHPVQKTIVCPSVPKLPEPVSVLSGSRLNLHNNILSLLRSGDLQEASLLVRHSVYSNCRPTIYTINAVLSALLREKLQAELLALHRFVIQAGIVPNIVTHNLIIQCYVDRRRLDLAIEYYRFFCRELPLLPSPTTYRILIEALVDASRIEDALQLNEEMVSMIKPDAEVYNLLMSTLVDNGDPERALRLYEELKEKLDEDPKDIHGTIRGGLMKAYFKKGMDCEAMELYNSVIGEECSWFKFSARNHNSVLDALCQNGKLEEALALFEKMMSEHSPPVRVSVDLESFKLIANGFCATGRFKEAINVFGKIGEKNISADTLTYNNLIRKLAENGMLAEAEELHRQMCEHGVKPNELTFVLLMETCFSIEKIEDVTRYFNVMVESGLQPGSLTYNMILTGFVKAGRLDEARVYFNEMLEKELKWDLASYEILLEAFCEVDRLEDVLIVVKALMMDDGMVFRPEMVELVEAAARRAKKEEELVKFYDEVDKEKEEALIRAAEEKARLDALDREERLRKRDEAKAKQAATTKITKEHIEMHIKRNLLSNMEERQDAPLLSGISWNGSQLRQVSDNVTLTEGFNIAKEFASHSSQGTSP
ncbi:hypothetical protein HPP92_008817 [Vanilla planifolia]|uniref:Pentatricopeptide repeat-containing protein n=1 Tax=Vanilla planifolia TaxID=51239 RepID=A0A835R6S0_VANPL|nr:hypothetical protein HPP92_008817 [Vanilla planifolia]